MRRTQRNNDIDKILKGEKKGLVGYREIDFMNVASSFDALNTSTYKRRNKEEKETK